jgi:hypothetical protein
LSDKVGQNRCEDERPRRSGIDKRHSAEVGIRNAHLSLEGVVDRQWEKRPGSVEHLFVTTSPLLMPIPSATVRIRLIPIYTQSRSIVSPVLGISKRLPLGRVCLSASRGELCHDLITNSVHHKASDNHNPPHALLSHTSVLRGSTSNLGDEHPHRDFLIPSTPHSNTKSALANHGSR